MENCLKNSKNYQSNNSSENTLPCKTLLKPPPNTCKSPSTTVKLKDGIDSKLNRQITTASNCSTKINSYPTKGITHYKFHTKSTSSITNSRSISHFKCPTKSTSCSSKCKTRNFNFFQSSS